MQFSRLFFAKQLPCWNWDTNLELMTRAGLAPVESKCTGPSHCIHALPKLHASLQVRVAKPIQDVSSVAFCKRMSLFLSVEVPRCEHLLLLGQIGNPRPSLAVATAALT